jgi:hypothetical protein
MVRRNRNVFINCPFDSDYRDFFEAIVFVVIRSGFRVRCALETDDGSENRFEKICGIIGECRYGIHDISRTEIDSRSKLPRFNMPLELGVFLGAKRFGAKAQRSKRCIILDIEKFRYQSYISDIAGQDIHAHQGNAAVLIEKLAGWLRSESTDPKVPGGREIAAEYALFKSKISEICSARSLEPAELTFGDYADMVGEYVAGYA